MTGYVEIKNGSRENVLETLRRLWCIATLQSSLVLEVQTMDQSSTNRRPRLSKSEGLGHFLVKIFHKKRRECTKRPEKGLPRSACVPLRTGYAQ